MKKIQMKIISLILGAGIVLTSIPAAAVQAASNSAIAQTKKQIIGMTDTIQKQEKTIGDLAEQMILTGDKIIQNEGEIVSLNEEIESTNQEVAVTKETLGEKEDLYGKRLREVYKSGNTSLIRTMLSAKNLSDLLLKYKAVENIAKHDKDLIETITGLKDELEQKARVLVETKTKLETATTELKDNQELLSKSKTEQETELANLNAEKTRLRELLASQEVELFADIQSILSSPDSTEAEVAEALSILETIQAQVSTAEAVTLGRQLAAKGQELASELKAARLEAERIAREKAEAERLARELEAKRKAAEKLKEQEEARRLAEERQKAADLAARKAREQAAAEAKADALEARQKEQAAQAAKLKAQEADAKAAADKAKEIADSEPKDTSTSSSNNLTFYLSFYSDLPEENGGWTVTATGDKLTYGVVANNVWPLYTKIYLEGWGTMTVKDRGGSHFYSRYRLDVFIPRKSGETNTEYRSRILRLGRQTVKGRILK